MLGMDADQTEQSVWRLFRGAFFRLAYPDFWEMEIIENIPAFYDPDGSGALQVAATVNSDGPYDLKEEFTKYLQRHEIEFDDEKVVRFQTDAGWECLAGEFFKEERFWLVYLLGVAEKMIIVCYNSDEMPSKPLVKIISQIIRSITPE